MSAASSARHGRSPQASSAAEAKPRRTKRRAPVAGKQPAGPAASIAQYVAALPPERRRRFLAIRAAISHAGHDVAETMRGRVPTFHKRGRWVALANRKKHLAVHVCAPELLAGIRVRHPELDCGAACVRIRDTQHVPVYELREAFRAAFGATKQ